MVLERHKYRLQVDIYRAFTHQFLAINQKYDRKYIEL